MNEREVQQPRSFIHLTNLVKTYMSAAGDLTALNGINLKIFPGEFVAITGKSGAGKTTLINMITGIDRLTSGEVWVDSKPIHKLPENKLAQWRGRTMGIIYQSFHLMPNLSLIDNILLPVDLCGLYQKGESTRRAMELLTQVGLQDHAHKPPSAISGGQQQRVAIARALVNDPPIIVADEPTGRLDSVTADSIFQIFQSLADEGKTIIIVTHDPSLARQASRVIEVADGEIVSKRTPQIERIN
ncbi:MAG: ABC transporter ATP-binding protein [Chloroflexota bacterium]|nr:MAG: ABC transporter ATP-binding protein [Chloroflexota bacterium]